VSEPGTATGPTALPATPEQQTTLDSLSAALGERFRFQLDHRDPSRPARFVAIARTSDIRPSLVMTDKPAELLAMLSGPGPRTGEEGKN
jgi:hypothetical protein